MLIHRNNGGSNNIPIAWKNGALELGDLFLYLGPTSTVWRVCRVADLLIRPREIRMYAVNHYAKSGYFLYLSDTGFFIPLKKDTNIKTLHGPTLATLFLPPEQAAKRDFSKTTLFIPNTNKTLRLILDVELEQKIVDILQNNGLNITKKTKSIDTYEIKE